MLGLVCPQEALPNRYRELHEADLEAADCVIVIGTSLQVMPVSNLPRMCRDGVPRLLINAEKVGADEADFGRCFYFDDVRVLRRAGRKGGNWERNTGKKYLWLPCLWRVQELNYRDVFFEGSCDAGVNALSDGTRVCMSRRATRSADVSAVAVCVCV